MGLLALNYEDSMPHESQIVCRNPQFFGQDSIDFNVEMQKSLVKTLKLHVL